MWNKFYDLMKMVFMFGEQTRKNTDKIDTLQEDVQQLTNSMQRMAYEIQRLRDDFNHFQDNERHEREKMALRLENALLKSGKSLPAPKSEEEE